MCADGATSKLAIQLGLVKQPPQGSCSRSYVDGGTHKFNADGVIFYHTPLLPGRGAMTLQVWFHRAGRKAEKARRSQDVESTAADDV